MTPISISPNVSVGGNNPLLLIAGPCQIESRDHALYTASALLKAAEGVPISLVYKSSYDKANRTSMSGKRGLGIDAGLRILQDVKKELGLPVLTDIHTPEQAKIAAEVVDIIQTPAFLCRQTELLIAAGQTGIPVNVKKGQFLAAEDMKYVAEKIASTGNTNVLLCERGTCFGYRDLIVDPRSLLIMKDLGYPVIFDATHSVQVMGGASGSSGGNRQFIEPLAMSAVTLGVSGVFIECHEAPDQAPSDGPSMLPLDRMPALIRELASLREYLTSRNTTTTTSR